MKALYGERKRGERISCRSQLVIRSGKYLKFKNDIIDALIRLTGLTVEVASEVTLSNRFGRHMMVFKLRKTSINETL